ncbi:MAG: amidohydrolase [Candidatus Thorarchaeota archaeon]
MSKDVAWKWIAENESHMIEVSNKIWEFAELGLLEFKSSELIAKTLEEYGFSVERGVADMPTAIVATYGSGSPVIGIMGEYDALPGVSQKAVSHQEPLAEGAPGHGCGHNIHGASGIAGAIAAKIAMEKSNIKGTIKFFGCPAEETYSGKVFMVRDGLFDDVDAAISHHAGSTNTAGIGSSLAVKSAKFHFHGVTAHAAFSPEHGRSALDALELMNIGVNYMREHVLQEARIHYVIEKGGLQPNVVPDYARSWYYIRAPEMSQVDEMIKWILDIAKGADLMARTTHTADVVEGCNNVIPNKSLSDIVLGNMREIGAPEYTKQEMGFLKKMNESIPKEAKIELLRMMKRPNWEEFIDVLIDRTIPDPWDEDIVWPGSTDVGDVSWVTPTMEFNSATGLLGDPGHSWQTVAVCGMSIGQKSMLFAAKTIAGSALDLLTKPDQLKTVQDEFNKRLMGRKYKCPIPIDVKPPHHFAREAAKATRT